MSAGWVILGRQRVASETPRAPGCYSSPFREIGQQGDLLANLALLVFTPSSNYNQRELLSISKYTLHKRRRTGYGATTSSVFSEIYIQHVKNTIIAESLIKYHIVGYFQYVDDILIVYNKATTNTYDVFNIFNNILPTMKFTREEKEKNQLPRYYHIEGKIQPLLRYTQETNNNR